MTATHTQTNLTGAGLRVGDKLDKYEIVEQIGAGGFSVVWKGFDRLLNQAVAIKQVTTDSGADAESFRERFRNEAQVHKRLGRSNKHLVDIIDFVDDPRGLFIVMEYVDGPSLEQVLAQQAGPMDVKTALGVAAATAVALGAMHDQGVVHRDLKPANILLPKDGGLKVCDFGLATLAADQTAPTVGTVRYMAPELMNQEKVDGRADIYSLGMILYECLVGRDNFNDAFKVVLRDQRNQALRWMKWHTNMKVKAPPIRQYNSGAPEPIAQLIERMMEKDAGKRVGSAKQLIDAMKRQLQGAPAPGPGAAAKAAPVTAAMGDKTAPLPRSRKLLLIGVGTAALWITAALIYFGMQKAEQNKELRQRQQAVLDEYYQAAAAFEQMRTRIGAQSIEWTRYDTEGKPLGKDEKQLDEPLTWPTVIKMLRALADDKAFHGLRVRLDDEGGGGPLGPAVFARGQFAKAMIAFAEAKHEDALAALAEADKINDETHPVVVLSRGTIQDVRASVQLAQSLDRAESEIRKLMEAQRYVQAAWLLDKTRKDAEHLMTADQKERWDRLSQQISARAANKEADRALAEAAELAVNDRAGAIAGLQQWLADHEDNTSKHRVRQALEQMIGADQFDRTLDSGRAAEANGQFDLAIAKYEEAIKLDNARAKAEMLEKHIAFLRGAIAFANAELAFSEQNIAVAVAQYRECLAYNPDHLEAKQRLKQIAAADQIEQIKALAVKAFQEGEYEKAINFWKQLRDEFNYDETEVAQRIAAAQLQIAIREMRKAWLEGDDDAILVAIDRVLELDPNNELALQYKVLVQTRKVFRAEMARGDEDRDAGEYGAAKLRYRKARQIAETIDDLVIRTQLVRQATGRLDDAEFTDAFTKAKLFFERGDYKQCLGQIAIAENVRKTEDLIALKQAAQAASDKQGN